MNTRSLIGFVLLVVWTGIPALACLPNQGVTPAEMACCKKMAGDCQMGVGQHPCCKTNVSPVAPIAKLGDAIQVQLHALAAAPLCILPRPARIVDCAFSSQLGLPPPTPPAVNSVLKI
jgi:hypothetical protein